MLEQDFTLRYVNICACSCVCTIRVFSMYIGYQLLCHHIALYKCDYKFQMGLPMEAKPSTTDMDHLTSQDTADTQQTDVAMVTTDERGKLQ